MVKFPQAFSNSVPHIRHCIRYLEVEEYKGEDGIKTCNKKSASGERTAMRVGEIETYVTDLLTNLLTEV